MRALARQTFASLSIRNYRLFFFGMMVSASGTWMQSVAQGWLVLELTGSGTAVGTVTAIQFVPMLLAGVWGGVIADRFDKRRTLYASQVAMAVVAGGLAVVTITDVVTLWMVYLSAFLIGCATVVDNPTRQAFVTELVGPDLVPNAVALNSAMFNAARIVGPAIAGVIILAAGTGVAFAYNSVSFVAVLVGLWMMRPEELRRGAPVAKGKGQVRAGIRYVWSTPELRSTVLLVAVVGTFTLEFNVVVPLLAKVTFDAGPGTLGLLTSAMGVGSLVGALTAAARSRPTPALLVGAAGALGAAMFAVAAAPTVAVAMVMLALAGGATITFLSTANSFLQINVVGEMRGRVMALYALVFLGSTPIGGPIIGWLSEETDPRMGFVAGGVAALVGAAGAWSGARQARRRTARSLRAEPYGAVGVVESGYAPDAAGGGVVGTVQP